MLPKVMENKFSFAAKIFCCNRKVQKNQATVCRRNIIFMTGHTENGKGKNFSNERREAATNKNYGEKNGKNKLEENSQGERQNEKENCKVALYKFASRTR